MLGSTWTPAPSQYDTATHGLNLDEVASETVAVTSKLDADPKCRVALPVTPPITVSSTYHCHTLNDWRLVQKQGGQFYGRISTGSSESAEACVRALEGGAGALVFSSGMSAITTALLTFLNSGDHVVAPRPMYSMSHLFLTQFAPKLGIEVSWVPAGCDASEYRKAIKPNTKVLYGETQCNPLMTLLDVAAFGALGRDTGLVTMVDSSFTPPPLLRPLAHGIDVSVHSATKYMSGHCDSMAGAVTVRTLEQWRRMIYYRIIYGNILSPWDCALLLRGLKTMYVRTEHACASALKVARWLRDHPKVTIVYYPGLEEHRDHRLAARQMPWFGGMIAFEVAGGLKVAEKFLNSLRMIPIGPSLGGVETLVNHPCEMTHKFLTPEEQTDNNITAGLIRLSIGIEAVDDIVKDIDQALGKAVEE